MPHGASCEASTSPSSPSHSLGARLYRLLSRAPVGRVDRDKHFPVGETPAEAPPQPRRPMLQPLRNVVAIAAWKACGRPIPPPHAHKVRVLKRFARTHRLRTLIETGTLLGDMIWATRHDFAQIYSIELDPRLHRRAQQRFADYPHVHIVLGDSGSTLPQVLADLREPGLLWLDGHYDGSGTALGVECTPILRELDALAAHAVKNHVILIDDARAFGAEGSGYPPLEPVLQRLREINPRFTVEVRDDIIQAYVPSGS